MNSADFMSQRPGLPGPQDDVFGQMLRDVIGRMDQFQNDFPRGGAGPPQQMPQQQPGHREQLMRQMQYAQDQRGGQY